MNTEDRDRILEEALECDGERRRLLLDARCAGNAAMRDEIERLIEIDAGGAGDFLDAVRPRPEPPRLAEGERVGRYVIRREIGCGGMSRVYEAEDEEIQRLVALKVLPGGDGGRTSGFADEVRLLGRMQHEHIVRLYDLGEHRGSPYLVMERLSGETLAAAIAAKRVGDRERQVDIALQVAAAVRQIHDAGIVHQDIKPSNVFVEADGRVKLLDFGIACRSADSADPRVLLGTPEYMAPEQMHGQGPSKASDMYAFGVLLFELFTGMKPFSGTQLQVFAAKLAAEKLPAAPMRAAGLPEPLQTVLAELTANNPAARPAIDLAVRDLEAATGRGIDPDARIGGAARDDDTRARQLALEQVQHEVHQRLEQSLCTTAPVPHRCERQPHRVDSPWASEFGLGTRRTSERQSDLLSVLAPPAMRRRVLILGPAGSGKTTALLQLAQELVLRAQRDRHEPIPILLSLSSWTDDRPFDIWLVQQLHTKYGVRRDHGLAWLAESCLTTLFDGLDELRVDRQAHCVDAINRFLRGSRPPHVAVCCRLAEYEMLDARLQLDEAVCLLPWDDGQIQSYLERAGCPDAWPIISADPEALATARSPLFLHMMTDVEGYTSTSTGQAGSSVSERRAALCDQFIRRLLVRARPEPGYSSGRTVRWLSRLATVMQRDGQTDFLIEGLQPADWLGRGALRRVYRGIVALCTSAAVLASLAAGIWLTAGVPRGQVSGGLLEQVAAFVGPDGFGASIVLGIALAAACTLAARARIVPIETLRWSGSKAWTGGLQWFLKAMAFGITVALRLGVVLGTLAGAALIWTDAFGRAAWTTSAPAFRAGLASGAASGLLVGALLMRRPRGTTFVRIPRGRHRWSCLAVCVLCTGVNALNTLGVAAAACYGVGLGMAAAASVRHDGSGGAHFLRAIALALAAAFTAGVAGLIVFRVAMAQPIAFGQVIAWTPAMFSGAVSVGAAVALAGEMRAWRRISHPPRRADSRDRSIPPVLQVTAIAAAAGLVSGVLWGTRHAGVVGDALRLVLGFGAGQLLIVAFTAFAIVALGLAALPVALFAGLFGGLGGLTGPDVVPRVRPNQGIHQSAGNIPLFVVLGMLFVGLPYGLLSLGMAAALADRSPEAADWLRLGVFPGVWYGALAGLLPGAACIQHGTLRLILACTGAAPLRYRRFLDDATDRKLLQRIGGRYRFLHPILRDHFVTMRAD